jgi:hypothetical protein
MSKPENLQTIHTTSDPLEMSVGDPFLPFNARL